MAKPRKSTRRGMTAFAIILGWGAIIMTVGYFAYASLERFGSTTTYTILSGTAHIDGCESSWFAAPYECQATVTWTDPITREQRKHDENVSVYAEKPLSGDVAVERRTNKDRKASRTYGRVYAADYPLYSHTTITVVAIFAVLIPTVIVPRKILKRLSQSPRDTAGPGPGAPKPGAVPNTRRRRNRVGKRG